MHVVALLFTGLLGNKFGGLLQGVGQQPALLPNAVVVKIGAPLFAAALPLAQGRVIHIVYLCVFRVASVLLRLEAGAIGIRKLVHTASCACTPVMWPFENTASAHVKKVRWKKTSSCAGSDGGTGTAWPQHVDCGVKVLLASQSKSTEQHFVP